MTISQVSGQQSTDPTSSVHDAAEALAVLWTRSANGIAHRVSASQLRALLIVQRAGTTNLTQLAESLGAMLSSASRLCERLVAAGLLERRAQPANRRELALQLTAEGEELLERIEAERRSDIARVLARMTPAQCSALVAGLTAFADAAESLHDAASSRSGDVSGLPG